MEDSVIKRSLEAHRRIVKKLTDDEVKSMMEKYGNVEIISASRTIRNHDELSKILDDTLESYSDEELRQWIRQEKGFR